MTISLLPSIALLLAASRLAAAQTITLGAPCTGASAYCTAGDIILRCYTSTIEAGNCNDELDEPSLGALCVDTATATGSSGAASCSAYAPATTTSVFTTTSVSSSAFVTPSLGASCTGTAAFCAATPGGGPIIIRCEDSTVVAGNCDDNLSEPANGAVCVGSAPSAYCSAYPTATSTSSSAFVTPSLGASCTGTAAFCAATPGGGPIIIRCEDSMVVAGNCDDNLGEPANGAVCVGNAPSAYCSAYPTVASTTSSTSSSTPSRTATITSFTFPSLGATCTGTAASCAATPGRGPIIFRCEDSTVVAGNCDDNLGEPANGAVCVGIAPSAYCSAYPTTSSSSIPSTSATTTITSTSSSAYVFPSLGATCTGTAASCAATPGGGPIIFRCEDSTVVAGNCADNLGEPMYGAVCVGNAPTASCSALGPPSSSSGALYSSDAVTTAVSNSVASTGVSVSAKASTTPIVIGQTGTATASVVAYTGAAAPGVMVPRGEVGWVGYVAGMVVVMGVGAAFVGL